MKIHPKVLINNTLFMWDDWNSAQGNSRAEILTFVVAGRTTVEWTDKDSKTHFVELTLMDLADWHDRATQEKECNHGKVPWNECVIKTAPDMTSTITQLTA